MKIELDIVLTPQALPKLVNGEVDIVLGAVEEEFASSETFETRELVKLQFAAGCGPNSTLASKPVVSVAELAASPIVLYQDDEQLISEVIRAIEERAGCEFNIALKTKSLLAALEMVSTGDYVVFLARPLLDKIPGMGIKVIHLDRELYTFQTAAYFRKSLLRTRHFQKLLADVQKVDILYQDKPESD